jgi:hypothetical protein
MARKKPADAAKAKAAKQKRLVIILSAVLVLAMGYAVKTMMGMSGGGQPQAAPAPAAAPSTPAAPAAAPTATPVAPSLAGGSVPGATATPAPPTADLVAAVRPTASTGQLQSFSLFESKDPFANGKATAKTPGTSGGSGSGSGKKPAAPPVTPPAPPAPPVTTAVISVNGVSESVSTGAAFPAANPIFQLATLTAKTAGVTVVGGSYATGAPALTLTVNKPVTLQNTADGTRYTLLLLPQGTTPTAPASGSGGSTVPPATTPATTPTTPTTPTKTGG